MELTERQALLISGVKSVLGNFEEFPVNEELIKFALKTPAFMLYIQQVERDRKTIFTKSDQVALGLWSANPRSNFSKLAALYVDKLGMGQDLAALWREFGCTEAEVDQMLLNLKSDYESFETVAALFKKHSTKDWYKPVEEIIP